jgi:hypothetical protein
MKKLFTLLTLVALCATATNAQTSPKLPNGGMEQWTTLPIPGLPPFPTGWLTLDLSAMKKTVEKTTDKRSGNFALTMTPDTIDTGFFPISLSAMQLGSLNILTFSANDGAAFTGRPSKLSMWLKRDEIPGKGGSDKDTLAISMDIELTKWNKTEKKQEKIGTLQEDVLIDKPFNKVYKEVVLPIKYLTSDQPDTLNMGLLCFYAKLKPSPIRITMDDLAFVYTVGTKDLAANNIKIYPNPAMDFVILETEDMLGANSVTLYNLNGAVVLQQTIDDNKFRLSLDNIPNGLYLYQIRNKEGQLLIGNKIEVIKN